MPVAIQIGDALACLRAMPAASVHCCVTSPPYWGLRDYGTPPQIWGGDAGCRHQWGAEGKSGQRLRNGIGATTSEGGRIGQQMGAVLHPSTGAFCRHCGAWRGALGLEPDYRLYVDHLVAVLREVRRTLRPDGSLWLNLGDSYATGAGKGLKPKDLVGIPWRVAFALQDDGWWLRRDIIWAKPNPMPESVRDRCTTAHEYLFHLSKSARYYYDHKAIEEPASCFGRQHSTGIQPPKIRALQANGTHGTGGDLSINYERQTRNKRSVWTIATAPYAGAHFATYPPALIEPCILAGCPAGGTVLDPFLGAGTTALVADRLGRHCIGIELSPAYAQLARRRLGGPALAAASAAPRSPPPRDSGAPRDRRGS